MRVVAGCGIDFFGCPQSAIQSLVPLGISKPNLWRLADCEWGGYVHVLFWGSKVKIPVWALAVGGVVTLVLCVISGVIGGALTRNFGTSSYTLSYADFISVMLTAISVLLALVSIFFAVLGVIGWTSISRGVRFRVDEFMVEGFKEGGSLRALFEREAEKARFRGVEAIDLRDLEDEEGKAENG